MAATHRPNANLESALADARARFAEANPRSAARQRAAEAAMPGGNTRTVLHYAPFPLAMARGEGCRLWDVDGHMYVDFLAEYTAGLFGHSDRRIRTAIDAALDDGITLSGVNTLEPRFASLVRDRFPSIDLVRFTNSGTEANMMAIATAKVVTGRSRVMVFEGGYHGGTLYFGHGGIPINLPHDWVLATYNDLEGTRARIRAEGANLAAVVIEPMLGSGGCIPADQGFLEMLRAETRASGALLVFDEVMTSRLAPGGLQEATGVIPDLTTLGKYIGGGMTVGAFGGRRDVMEIYDPTRAGAMPHAGTFNNNVLTMSAGIAALGEVYTPDAARALNARGDALRARLNALAAGRGAPLRFSGQGSMMAAHFTTEPVRTPADGERADPGLKEILFLDLLAAGVYIARRGMFVLSLPVGDAECDVLAAAVDEFLATRGQLLAQVTQA
jgi:glutamate-1-semialdehyde 2,1-aminomutase